MPINRKTFFPSFLLLAAMVALLFCGRDYNPFTDLDNAKVHIISGGIADGDTIPLYSTKTLKVVVALYEEVESFVIRIPGNRHWTDTTLGAGQTTLTGGPYLFSVSFFDTGMQEIAVSTRRSNGVVVTQVMKVYVTNPLHPSSVNGLFGKPVALSTPRVADNGVVYHWSFAPGRKDSSYESTFSRVFYYFTPAAGTGELWVTDMDGRDSTPKVAFTYSFDDSSPPIITSATAGEWRGDTLESGAETLLFKVRIFDSGTSEIDSCSINGKPFETAPSRDNVYAKIFDSLPVLTRGDVPYQVVVYARDNPGSPSRSTTRTFWLLYKSGAGSIPLMEITILVPSSQNAVSSKRYLTVTGAINSYFTVPRAMDLRMRVNGSLEAGIRSFSDSSFHGSPVYWYWPVYLDNSVNTITATVKTADGDSATTSTVVLYDPNVTDVISPVIYEVTDSADGRRLDNDKDSGAAVIYTTKPELTLKIITFDDGSGIHDVTMNDLPLQLSTQMDYLWFANTGPIAHSGNGTRCQIRVTDNENNYTEKTLTIIRNTPPELEVTPAFPNVFYSDSTYVFHVRGYDAEQDPVTIQWYSRPDSMFFGPNGRIVWRPRHGDLPGSIIMQASDGFSLSDRFVHQYEVGDSGAAMYPARFLTTELDFPVVLQANRDTLSLRLVTDTVYPALRYSARFLDRNRNILQASRSANLVWSPVLSDTGYRRLMVTVGDSTRTFDTITPAFQVVRRNEYPCSLSYRFSGTKTQAGELDLFTHPAAETLYFAIHDRDNPLTEKYTVSVSQKNINTVQVIDKGEFIVAVRPDAVRILDTLTVSVRDRTGTTDSERIIIRYAVGSRFPCSLSYTYTGRVVSPGVLRRVVRAVPDTVKYTIIDNDLPNTEQYTVSVTRNGQSVPSLSDTLSGSQRAFNLRLTQSAIVAADTFVCTIRDLSGTSFASRFVVQYIPPTPYIIPNTTLYVSSAEGVSTTGANFVTSWMDMEGGQALSQGTATDRPTLVPDAVNGEPALRFIRDWDNGLTDDALHCGSCDDWDDLPFTIFVVFNLDSMNNLSRQTLVASSNDGSLSLGITCNGKIGMFSETPGTSCVPNATVSSNLTVSPHTWYVVTYQSSYGIVNTTISMDAWLNGTRANSTLAMTNAKEGTKIMVGAGRNGGNSGSLCGSIASVVMFNRSLTVVERQAVERALGTKYGIAIP